MHNGKIYAVQFVLGPSTKPCANGKCEKVDGCQVDPRPHGGGAEEESHNASGVALARRCRAVINCFAWWLVRHSLSKW